MPSQEFKYFMGRDFRDHSGHWVAISGSRIISSNTSIGKTMREAKAIAVGKEVLFTKIPKKNQSLIL